ncbi:hypothetical protein OO006_12690 [Prosthecochloris sp. SCSIO W1101]|uniref:hypothetical protein n=1 Tax=Prosthecochloris sp. SCSIO W1101 TaxID=2992242 RepID=UPI00223E166B|nr:hypothetical protein [Prosthecochloris sp. SCSIO W1101]UZJ41187.1 hypothetical protein OO006_12690 [Prosthecochloris sp. SCSIO W1101]
MDIKVFQKEVGGAVDEVLSVYEESVGTVEQIIAAPCRFIELGEEISTTRKEREQIVITLKSLLASNDSLRKKDFDYMMSRILEAQEKREAEVRSMLRSYFDEQRETASALRGELRVFRDNLGGKNDELIGQFRRFIEELFQEREQRKRDVEEKLNEYNESQQHIADALRKLLKKGREIRVRDLKNLLAEFDSSRIKRKKEQGEREKQVADMLKGFKAERLGEQNVDQLS